MAWHILTDLLCLPSLTICFIFYRHSHLLTTEQPPTHVPRTNRKHSQVYTKSCSLTSLLAPVAAALLLPLPPIPATPPPAPPLTQRKSTEPPDERRGLLMSSRRMPGLGRRGSTEAAVTAAAGVLRMVSADSAVATIGSVLEPLVSPWFVCIATTIHCAGSNARTRPLCSANANVLYPYIHVQAGEATITRAVDARSSNNGEIKCELNASTLASQPRNKRECKWVSARM